MSQSPGAISMSMVRLHQDIGPQNVGQKNDPPRKVDPKRSIKRCRLQNVGQKDHQPRKVRQKIDRAQKVSKKWSN